MVNGLHLNVAFKHLHSTPKCFATTSHSPCPTWVAAAMQGAASSTGSNVGFSVLPRDPSIIPDWKTGDCFHSQSRRFHIWMYGWHRRLAMIGAQVQCVPQDPPTHHYTDYSWLLNMRCTHNFAAIFSVSATNFGSPCWPNRFLALPRWPPFLNSTLFPSFHTVYDFVWQQF